MKEIISTIVILATAIGGGAALKSFHDTVRRAALEKAAKGLPSLTQMTRSLKRQRGGQDRIENRK